MPSFSPYLALILACYFLPAFAIDLNLNDTRKLVVTIPHAR